MMENYSAEFARLAHENGLRNTFESYTTIGHDLDNANFTDEPTAAGLLSSSNPNFYPHHLNRDHKQFYCLKCPTKSACAFCAVSLAAC